MFVSTFEKAKAQAKANAVRTKVPWGIFRDTNGNFCVERATYSHSIDMWIEIYDPQDENWPDVTRDRMR